MMHKNDLIVRFNGSRPRSERIHFNSLIELARHNFVITLDQDLKDGSLDLSCEADFALVLETASKTCGLTMTHLAGLFEVNHTTASRWMRGKSAPLKLYRYQFIMKLRDAVKGVGK